MRVLKKEIWPAKILVPFTIDRGEHYNIENWLGENMGAFKGRRGQRTHTKEDESLDCHKHRIMNIIKQEIIERTQKLTTKWTVTYEAMEPDIKEVIEGGLAKTLQEEIDWEIMCDMLKQFGYTKVEMKWPERINEVDAHMIKEWCRENLTGHYQGRGKTWMFEKEKDASLFILRWA